jgi:hypothetical protein
MSVGRDYISELRPPVDLFFIPICHMSMDRHGGMILTGETLEIGEKPVPASLCPLQIAHGLTQARTRSFAVKGRRLTV